MSAARQKESRVPACGSCAEARRTGTVACFTGTAAKTAASGSLAAAGVACSEVEVWKEGWAWRDVQDKLSQIAEER